MVDITSLSDEQLKAMYSQEAPASPIAALSDEELKAMYPSKAGAVDKWGNPADATFMQKLGAGFGSKEQWQKAASSTGTQFSLVGHHTPILGSQVEMTPEMAKYEEEHPGRAFVNKALGATVPTAMLAPFAPEMAGFGGLAARAGYWGGAETGLTYADAKARGEQDALRKALGAGAFAAGGSGIGDVVGGVIAPRLSESVRYLLDRNIPLTPGQMIGGAARRAEDVAQSLPVLGSAVRSARERATEGFNRTIGNETLGHLDIGDPRFAARGIQTELPERYPAWHQRAGQQIDPGFESRQFTRENIQRAYDTAYDGVNLSRSVPMFADIRTIGEDLTNQGVMTPAIQARYEEIIQGQLGSRFDRVQGLAPGSRVTNSGRLNGDAISNVDTQLRELAERYGQGTGDERILGMALDRARGRFHQEVSNQFPQAAQRLNAADQAWRHYSVTRGAGASTAVQGEEGLITPTQLRMASKANDPSYEKVATSEGRATFEQLAHHGKQVLPSKVADSGTAERLGTGALAALMITQPHVGVPTALGLAGGAGLYTSPVQSAIRNLLSSGHITRPVINAAAPTAGAEYAKAHPNEAQIMARFLGAR